MKVAAVLAINCCAAACSESDTTVTQLAPAAFAVQAARSASASRLGEEDLSPRLLRRFKSLPALDAPLAPELVLLGRTLYFDPRLSRDGSISCNSCHPLDHYGATNAAVSTGINGRHGTRNAPSTYNASAQFRQFWDGRAATIEEQVAGPLQNPAEMGMDEATLVKRLSGLDGYGRLFAAAFPQGDEPISEAHVARAIAEFERGLLTPARWDRYLAGDVGALSSREKAGAKIFANLGCMVCHEGQLLGGSMYQKVGVMLPWPNQRDHGRRDLSGNAVDDMVFKVPSLRNVAKTAPYFHDGSVAALPVAVQMMARHQLGLSLTDEETGSIVAWMNALTGDIAPVYVRAPALPPAARP